MKFSNKEFLFYMKEFLASLESELDYSKKHGNYNLQFYMGGCEATKFLIMKFKEMKELKWVYIVK